MSEHVESGERLVEGRALLRADALGGEQHLGLVEEHYEPRLGLDRVACAPALGGGGRRQAEAQPADRAAWMVTQVGIGRDFGRRP